MCGFCELLFWGGGKYLELQLGGLRRQNGGPRLLPSLPWGRGTQRRAAGLGLVGGGKINLVTQAQFSDSGLRSLPGSAFLVPAPGGNHGPA